MSLRQKKEPVILSEQTGASSDASQPSETHHESVPANVREEVLSARFSGPLPLPSSFREYDEILPGSAERILRMAEEEQAGRHEWDKAALDGALKENARVQFLGTILSIIFAGVAFALAMFDRELPASAFAVACLASGILHFKSWRSK